MRVRVKRTSLRSRSERPPCKEATPHPTVDGAWVMEVPDLESLLALSKALNKELVVFLDGDEPVIEIYDDYRE